MATKHGQYMVIVILFVGDDDIVMVFAFSHTIIHINLRELIYGFDDHEKCVLKVSKGTI